MTESEKTQIKGALLKCADENANRTPATGCVVVSSVCKAAVERIVELESQVEEMKCCGNCGNERCTSKYRGNSAYHTQTDGYACAGNEDWVMRKPRSNEKLGRVIKPQPTTKLAEAKEIIKFLLDHCEHNEDKCTFSEYIDVIGRAEKFINEE